MAIPDDRCVLCGVVSESIDHLHFKCQFSKELCHLVADWLQIRRIPTRRNDWTHWLRHLSRCEPVQCRVWNVGFVAVAMIWHERNSRIFGPKRRSVMHIFFKLKREVTLRTLGCVSGGKHEQLVRTILRA